MKMKRLIISLVLLCLSSDSANLFGQKRTLLTESATTTTFTSDGGCSCQIFDFYFPSYFDDKSNKNIFPDNECRFYIIRFELQQSQIVVKTIECDGSSGKDSRETVLETFCFNPSNSEFLDYLIGDGSSIDYFILSSIEGKSVCVIKKEEFTKKNEQIRISYDRMEPNWYHAFTQKQLATLRLQQKQICTEYKIEDSFQTKYDALRNALKEYSFTRPCY